MFSPSYLSICLAVLSAASAYSTPQKIERRAGYALKATPGWSNEGGQGGLTFDFAATASGGWSFSFSLAQGFSISQVNGLPRISFYLLPSTFLLLLCRCGEPSWIHAQEAFALSATSPTMATYLSLVLWLLESTWSAQQGPPHLACLRKLLHPLLFLSFAAARLISLRNCFHQVYQSDCFYWRRKDGNRH
jgi:hypothetical protein